jgi:hypothetical protein
VSEPLFVEANVVRVDAEDGAIYVSVGPFPDLETAQEWKSAVVGLLNPSNVGPAPDTGPSTGPQTL